MLIDEAVTAGAGLSKACERIGITERTYYRWKALLSKFDSYEDRRSYADHSNPVNKLTPTERQEVIDTCNTERFASLPPCQIVPALADEGKYIASERTFYRILHEAKMQNHRGRSQEPGKHHKPTSFCATTPNQVWTWDITYLNGPVKGYFYYLYLIIDIFSRDVVGWEVWEDQTAELASELIKKACLSQHRLSTAPLVLHSDNGTPMKGATMLETLYALGITPSNARGWCAKFVKWYRYEHHHSGIKFLTAAERHAGKSEEILNKRHEVYEAAKAAHPERWNGRETRNWNNITEVYLNPDRQYEETPVELSNDEEIAS